MYKPHICFNPPENKEVKIWRYINFTELISLFEESALYFSRADKLEDPFEGSLPLRNVEIRNEMTNLPTKVRATFPNIYKGIRKFMYINCWHMNNFESEAMWRLYLKSDEGLAIQSTFNRLTKSLDSCKDKDIYVGTVKYIDFSKDVIPVDNMFYPYLRKRVSYSHEQELRAVFLYMPSDMPKEVFDLQHDTESGFYIPTDLKSLVETIYISPASQEWIETLVRKILKRYGLDIEVRKSSLNSSPLF